MQPEALIIELVKYVGFPAVIFAIWFFYHKAQVEAFKTILAQYEEQNKQHFAVLKDMVETNQAHVAILSRMESKLDIHRPCPISQDFKRGG